MALVVETTERQLRYRMSFEEYLALPEGVRAEYVDGEVVVTPPTTRGHNRAQRRLANLIEAALDPELDVVTEAGWQSETRVRVPDLAVFAEHRDVPIDHQVPILVVEVLSPGTRAEDTLRKSGEYLRAGIEQYWVLDRDHRTLTVLASRLTGGEPSWDVVLQLDVDRPRGEVTVGARGTVRVDLDALLAP